MFDLGWTELMVVGIVALIVVGPKDLPVLFRNVGRFVGKAKGMAREFSRAMNDAADEAGVKDMAQGLKAATNPVGTAMDGVKEAAQDMAKSIDPTKFDPDSETGKLAAERAADAKKIQEATARAASDRQAREAEEAAAAAEAAKAGAGEPDQDKETKS
ncbi:MULTISPECIES: Sec-independent protein translocase protein TatB [Rhodobacterales]|jgi:sec-independent protein translocase protein TatB|uniref:Sec-independent protein translocase protein TatB n=1 Tax=Rhodobacterales TaxID=204455 RepID=UPI00237FC0DE|nr:Sec-independent protein translocase protein TatB [Phaeobacter gallaeciensis]MDE4138877.1 Sec-independent protein translocase protein TatB [Phaeobacter gallaeciensis]MDE4148065.1 Sec-independent protein translocase protein TatB [Phaeobacter gallaeciensis]MDE4152283.1 Sec-independent protein translocase protein TatB [Phaeobacter gallaeciensis]MDE4189539.1 Sec-independent protein translocase protein TatB [Phaeobacter gallaeciensis]MDE4198691.1 Sec-independent protein translocase protein TatB [